MSRHHTAAPKAPAEASPHRSRLKALVSLVLRNKADAAFCAVAIAVAGNLLYSHAYPTLPHEAVQRFENAMPYPETLSDSEIFRVELARITEGRVTSLDHCVSAEIHRRRETPDVPMFKGELPPYGLRNQLHACAYGKPPMTWGETGVATVEITGILIAKAAKAVVDAFSGTEPGQATGILDPDATLTQLRRALLLDTIDSLDDAADGIPASQPKI